MLQAVILILINHYIGPLPPLLASVQNPSVRAKSQSVTVHYVDIARPSEQNASWHIQNTLAQDYTSKFLKQFNLATSVWYRDNIISLVNSEYPEYISTLRALLQLENIFVADWAQYLILYHAGGIVQDSDVFYCADPRGILPGWPSYTGVWLGQSQETTGQIQNAIMAVSRPKHIFWKHILDQIKTQIENAGDMHILHLTGPYALVEAAASFAQKRRWFHPDYKSRNLPWIKRALWKAMAAPPFMWADYPGFRIRTENDNYVMHFSFGSWNTHNGLRQKIEENKHKCCSEIFKIVAEKCDRIIKRGLSYDKYGN